jgi:hypothetical protein
MAINGRKFARDGRGALKGSTISPLISQEERIVVTLL